MAQAQTAQAMKTRKNTGKNKDLELAIQTDQTKLIRCLLYGFVDYSQKGTKSFDVVTGDQELVVRTATYRPEIGQSQHAKSVSHIIKYNACMYLCKCIAHMAICGHTETPVGSTQPTTHSHRGEFRHFVCNKIVEFKSPIKMWTFRKKYPGKVNYCNTITTFLFILDFLSSSVQIYNNKSHNLTQWITTAA